MIEGGNRKQFTQSPDTYRPLVSIITVTKNAANCIERAIKSVQAQTYPNLEHIILDGASTDGTVEILKKYNDQIAYWRSEPDKGVYNAMNNAVTYAHGDWILFLGADDELQPGFSEMIEENMEKKNCVYYGCSLWKNQVLGQPFNAYRLAKENLCHQAMFYPKGVFDKYRYDEKYAVRADYVLNMQVWADKEFRFEYYPLLISKYAPGGLSGKLTDDLFKKDKVRLVGKYLGFRIMIRYIIKRYKYKRKNIIEY
jgi:glycosyltransferase involved in cell wall biosynthesis